jgi:hypothetical protein
MGRTKSTSLKSGPAKPLATVTPLNEREKVKTINFKRIGKVPGKCAQEISVLLEQEARREISILDKDGLVNKRQRIKKLLGLMKRNEQARLRASNLPWTSSSSRYLIELREKYLGYEGIEHSNKMHSPYLPTALCLPTYVKAQKGGSKGTQTNGHIMMVDSGCSHHMVNDESLLQDYETMAPIAISTANGGCIYAVGKGRLKTESNVTVNDVWHVPELSVSLASLSQMIDKGLRFNLSKDNMRAFNPD